MQPQPQQPNNRPSLWQQFKIYQSYACYPALTVMIYLRRNLGYRLVTSNGLFVTLVVLMCLGASKDSTPAGQALLGFGIISFFLPAFHVMARERQARRGIIIHTRYIGDSRLDFKWLPGFLKRNRRVARFIDPLVCYVIGFLLLFHSPFLAVWIGFSGSCIRSLENQVLAREEERQMDLFDNLIDSEYQAQSFERFAVPREDNAKRRAKPSAIATGLAPDVEEKIRRRNTQN